MNAEFFIFMAAFKAFSTCHSTSKRRKSSTKRLCDVNSLTPAITEYRKAILKL